MDTTALDRKGSPRLVGFALLLLGAVFGVVGMARPDAAHATPASGGQTITAQNLGHTSLAAFLASHGNSCDAGADGWHFILNQLDAGAGTVDASDLPASITITFSDGSQSQAAFLKLSGSTAHYLDSSSHQSDGVYPVSASLTFPAGTELVAYGQFVLSHVPCGFSAPTTIAPTTAAPTTAAPTTAAPTTAAPTTVAVLPPTTGASPSTTAAAPTSMAPSTQYTDISSAPPLVSVNPPVPPAPGASVAPIVTASPVLPETGSSTSALVAIGAGLFIVGFGLVIGASRRTPG